MQRMPFVLRVIGVILAFLGLMNIGAFFLVPEGAQMDMTAPDIAWNVGASALLIVTGLGLVLGARWSWPLALALSVAFIVFGVYLSAQPGDITSPRGHTVHRDSGSRHPGRPVPVGTPDALVAKMVPRPPRSCPQ